MNELTLIPPASMELGNRLQTGMILDRTQTKKLLRQMEQFGTGLTNCEAIKAQLQGVLNRRDWLTIGVSVEFPAGHVHIGIVTNKPVTRKTLLSPMQKFQRKNGLDRRSE